MRKDLKPLFIKCVDKSEGIIIEPEDYANWKSPEPRLFNVSFFKIGLGETFYYSKIPLIERVKILFGKKVYTDMVLLDKEAIINIRNYLNKALNKYYKEG